MVCISKASRWTSQFATAQGFALPSELCEAFSTAAANVLCRSTNTPMVISALQLAAVIATACSRVQLSRLHSAIVEASALLQGLISAEGGAHGQTGATHALALLMNGMSQSGDASVQALAARFAAVVLQQLLATATAAHDSCEKRLNSSSPASAGAAAATLAQAEQRAQDAEFVALMRRASSAVDILDVAAFGCGETSSRALVNAALHNSVGMQTADMPVVYRQVVAPLLLPLLDALLELTEVLSYSSAWHSAEGGKTLLQAWQGMCCLAIAAMGAQDRDTLPSTADAMFRCCAPLWAHVRLDDEVVVGERAQPAAHVLSAVHMTCLQLHNAGQYTSPGPSLQQVQRCLSDCASAAKGGGLEASHKGALQLLQGDLAVCSGAVHAWYMRQCLCDCVSLAAAGADDDELAMCSSRVHDAKEQIRRFWEFAWNERKSRVLVQMHVWSCSSSAAGLAVPSALGDALLHSASTGTKLLCTAADKLYKQSAPSQKSLLDSISVAVHCLAQLQGSCTATSQVCTLLLPALLTHSRTVLSGEMWSTVLLQHSDILPTLAMASAGVLEDEEGGGDEEEGGGGDCEWRAILPASHHQAWREVTAACEEQLGQAAHGDFDGPVHAVFSCLCSVACSLSPSSPAGRMAAVVSALHVGAAAAEAAAAIRDMSGEAGTAEEETDDTQEVYALLQHSVTCLLNMHSSHASLTAAQEQPDSFIASQTRIRALKAAASCLSPEEVHGMFKPAHAAVLLDLSE